MKKITIFAGVLAGMFLAASCNNGTTGAAIDGTETGEAAGAADTEIKAEAGDVVYVNMDRVMQEYNMAKDLTEALNAKGETIQAELVRKQNALQSEANDLNSRAQKGTITQSSYQVKAEALQKKAAAADQYAYTKNQEFSEEQVVTLNQITDEINSFLTRFNAEKKFAMILATSQTTGLLSTPVMVADPDKDITDAVIAGLNEEYAASKKN
ncbi:MAG: OmpH family outer membrane protein [Bacteroidales bacterium]|nr:OmpH family outer membrane protein [Bacteroidales bacterium]